MFWVSYGALQGLRVSRSSRVRICNCFEHQICLWRAYVPSLPSFPSAGHGKGWVGKYVHCFYQCDGAWVVAVLRVAMDTCVLFLLLVSPLALPSLRQLPQVHQLAMSLM